MSAAIAGPARSGKTETLVQRALAAEHATLCVPSFGAAVTLRRRIPAMKVRTLGEIALQGLRACGRAFVEIDDVDAFEIFRACAQPLLRLEWTELIEAEVDPEVPGLRSPDRFLAAAFRLIGRLRDAGLSPDEFRDRALRSAAQFYAAPPNLAQPELLAYTKETYRASLHVDGPELQRQYGHELDLAKIVAKLYAAYLEAVAASGRLTSRDVTLEAARVLRAQSARAAELRAELGALFVDEAQELTAAQIDLLRALTGEEFDGVTFAGDRSVALSTFQGARPDLLFNGAVETVVMPPPAGRAQLQLHRAATRDAEIAFVADHVERLISAGTAPEEIAILFRSVSGARVFADALIARDIPVGIVGDYSIFAEPEALDALAPLWFLCDPFRHDWLLRLLSGRVLALADATLQHLCAEPPDAQLPLVQTEESATARPTGRWDPRRDLRLGWNVIRGENDAQLSPVARDRLARLRMQRAHWEEALAHEPLTAIARAVWRDALAPAGAAGSARAGYQQQVLMRLLDRMETFERSGNHGMYEFLLHAQSRMESAFTACEERLHDGAVRIATIDAVRGASFEHVVIPRACAGSFPRWYVPDSFLFSPKLGMIAKENVGNARTARTAKFTYYMFAAKTRERYNDEERRAFEYARSRANRSVLVTASERPTRGITAPEFLAELQAMVPA